jgi:hypothetical protein
VFFFETSLLLTSHFVAEQILNEDCCALSKVSKETHQGCLYFIKVVAPLQNSNGYIVATTIVNVDLFH